VFEWPERKKIAVAPIVPWEIWPENLGTTRSHQRQSQSPNPPGARYDWNMWVLYDHDYAEIEGVPRLLDLFARHGVRVTFAANGKRLEESPELAKEVVEHGHEMASENYVHEYPPMYTPQEQRESLESTIRAFETVIGRRPVGYVSPGHRPTPETLPLLFEFGYQWDADFQNSDAPFLIDGPDGQVIVGTPYSYLSDYQTYQQVGRTPRMWLEMLRDDFAGLLQEGREGKPRIMGFAMHPFLSHPFRTVAVDEFLRDVLTHRDVWVVPREEITTWVRENPGDLRRESLEEVLARFPKQPPPPTQPTAE
jgi:peptidoglycan/xylan/chitin deacetylase (PgdA/CDA1 family)